MLEGHTNNIYDLIKLSNENLASCSGDKTIRIWNTSNYECLKVLSGHSDWVKTILEFPKNILTVIDCVEQYS